MNPSLMPFLATCIALHIGLLIQKSGICPKTEWVLVKNTIIIFTRTRQSEPFHLHPVFSGELPIPKVH